MDWLVFLLLYPQLLHIEVNYQLSDAYTNFLDIGELGIVGSKILPKSRPGPGAGPGLGIRGPGPWAGPLAMV